jgi:hypothetical protein
MQYVIYINLLGDARELVNCLHAVRLLMTFPKNIYLDNKYQ